MISRLPDTASTASVPTAETDDLSADLSGRAVKDLTQLFKLLADETRLRILELLGERNELCVRDLWERLGQSQPAVSHHLGLLRMGGLVDTRHQGKHIFYRIDQQRFDELMTLIHQTRFGAQVFSTPR
jgi:ArsR family transcriptional regulator, arsenate/arsenite/antimonite-responsive transcriptional repressor